MNLVHEQRFCRAEATRAALLILVPVLLGLPLVYQPFEMEFSLRFLLAVLLGFAVTLALHENPHGAAAWICGPRPTFHCSTRPFYVTVVPCTRVPVWRFRAIVAAPFVLLTPLFPVLHLTGTVPAFAWFAFLTNTIGSIADPLTLWALRRFDCTCLVEDTATGFRIYREE